MVWVLLAIVALLVLALVVLFNRLVRFRNHTRAAWSNVDAQLKRRTDLVPNLVETVKGYAAHEASTFEQVTAARAEAEGAQGPVDEAVAQNQLTQGIARLMAVAENYPDLKASSNFLDLQKSLSETEDKIAIARQIYNDTVQTYENAREQFPSNLVASMFRFHEVEFFKLDLVSDRATPQVQT